MTGDMSMMFMPMGGQTWIGASASFVGMWIAMMAAMMLPSLIPMLSRYRQAVGNVVDARLGWLTAVVVVGYFFVWTVVGMIVFVMGAALMAIEMQQPVLGRVMPTAVPIVILI